MNTAREVAEWMLEEVNRVEYLYQQQAVYDIQTRFGEEFTHINQNGNLGIAQSVLREFRKLTGDTVVWQRNDRMWRKRQTYDSLGREQL